MYGKEWRAIPSRPGSTVGPEQSPRAPSVRLLYRDERATPALLESLEDTRLGRTLGLALIGVVEEESELEEVVLWPEEEEGPGEESEEGGPGPP